jgi:hypothetical protein
MRIALALAGAVVATPPPSCSRVTTNQFCTGVTWNASLPLAPAELDSAARSDYNTAVNRLGQLGGPDGLLKLPFCLDSWKALQCASKFQKCSRELPMQKVCRSLCVQFAETCNGSESVLARCSDDLLYDEPPCTDYAELYEPYMLPQGGHLLSSPLELYNTVAGAPLLLFAMVVALHVCCCSLQWVAGGGGPFDGPDEHPSAPLRRVFEDYDRQHPEGARARKAGPKVT